MLAMDLAYSFYCVYGGSLWRHSSQFPTVFSYDRDAACRSPIIPALTPPRYVVRSIGSIAPSNTSTFLCVFRIPLHTLVHTRCKVGCVVYKKNFGPKEWSIANKIKCIAGRGVGRWIDLRAPYTSVDKPNQMVSIWGLYSACYLANDRNRRATR